MHFKLIVPLPFGEVSVRIGITFYEDRTLKSFEPNVPTNLNTKIGKITAYNTLASGINGDLNSVNLNKDGTIESLMTSTNKIIGTTSQGKKLCFEPKLKPSPIILGKSELIPLIIEFNKNKVLFNDKYKYKISNCVFEVTESTVIDELISCGNNCSTCSACH